MVSKYEKNWYLLFFKTTPYFTKPSFLREKPWKNVFDKEIRH